MFKLETTKRIWKTLEDIGFANNNPEVLKQFEGVTYCRSGYQRIESEDNYRSDHPEFCQKWPYNSYIEDAAIRQIIINDLSFWMGTGCDYIDHKWVKAGIDTIFPAVGNLLGSFFERRAGKKVHGNADNHNLEPAGCGPIAVLTLLWYFRNYPCVQEMYLGIQKIKQRYETSEPRDSTLEDIMKKIWNKNVVLKDVDYSGTGSRFIRFDKSVFVEIREKIKCKNVINHNLCKAIFEAVALNRIPVLVQFPTHWAVICGVEFDYSMYCITGLFNKSMKFTLNSGNDNIYPSLPVDDMQYGRPDKLFFYAPEDLITYCKCDDPYYDLATTTERGLAIRRRNEFNALVGNNYEKVSSAGCKFRKGEVVNVTNRTEGLLISSGLAVMLSDKVFKRNNIDCYKVSFATQEFLVAIGGNQSGNSSQDDYTPHYATGLSPMNRSVNCFAYIPVESVQKVFSNDLDCIFFRETNGIKANAQVFINKLAVGQYIYEEPTLITKSNFLGLGAAYISKIYADSSCDVYFPDKKKTFHSAICLGDDYIMNFNISAGSSTPAQFAVGEDVYYKHNDSYFKAKVTSLNAFVASSAERWYYIKADTESAYWKVTEKNIYKIVWRYDYSKY